MDAPTWAGLRQELWPEEDGTHWNEVAQFFRGDLPQLRAVLLAVDDHGEAVGFVELSIRQAAATAACKVGYVEGLYVVPAWRHRGVARALLHAARAWSGRRGCRAFASDRADRVIVDMTLLTGAAR
jgi:aminoglycoside 6'-N-acetyltransferase I